MWGLAFLGSGLQCLVVRCVDVFDGQRDLYTQWDIALLDSPVLERHGMYREVMGCETELCRPRFEFSVVLSFVDEGVFEAKGTLVKGDGLGY